MSQRARITASFLSMLLPAVALAQNQTNRNQLRPQQQYTFPFSQNPQPQFRSQVQQQQAQQQQSGRGQTFQIRPEQVQRWVEGFAPQQSNTYPQQGNAYPQQRNAYPRNSYRSDRRYPTRPPTQPYVVSQPPAAGRAVVTHDQFTLMPDDEQRRIMQAAIVSLEEEFARMSTGDSWAKYLRLQTLLRVIASEESTTPDADDRLRLETIADQFEAVQANASYQRIASMWGLQTLRNGLKAYAAEPTQRGRQRVAAHSKQLRDSLDRPGTGSGWKVFFQLDEIDKLAQSSGELTSPAAERLHEWIKRFDQANDNPKYNSVTQMNGFSATRDSLAKLADNIERLDDTGPRDAKDMERIARAVLQHLDGIKQASQEECKAQQALATSSGDEKARKTLAVIQNRHDEEMKQAQQGLKALIAAIKKQGNRDPAMQSKRLANRDDILKTIKKMKAYDPSDSAVGFKVLKSSDNSAALATKTLTLADRTRGAELIKKLQVYDQNQASKRVKLQWNSDRGEQANQTKELADTNRVAEIIKRLFEDSDRDNQRVAEHILMQFDDVPEEGEVTLMQFSDVAPEQVTLMQFSDVAEPAEVWVMPLGGEPEEVTVMPLSGEPEEVTVMPLGDDNDDSEAESE